MLAESYNRFAEGFDIADLKNAKALLDKSPSHYSGGNMRCSKCGANNRETARFCDGCGAALSEAAMARGKDTPRSGAKAKKSETLTGERRHLTVLFCDLVGSTAIAAQLDPEEWREIVADYNRAVGQAVEHFGGYVAKYLGDGVMAFFGYPEAHDNDAERAARAGLAILDAIEKLNRQPAHAKLTARIGIDSGAVVVGKGAGKDADVFGDAPNIAARVQAAAAPGTVAITDATHRLVSGLFIVEDCGTQSLVGIDRPVRLYSVIQASGVRGRFEAAVAAGQLTPFIGREDELRSLMNRWEGVLAGEGQVALIIGEAGIGKSRLVQRFHEQIAGTPHTWAHAGAGAFFQNTPFYPIAEMLQQFFGDAPSQDQIAQLESRLTVTGLKPAEAIPLIVPLLNLPLPQKYSPSTLSPEQQRRSLLTTLVEWVLGSARAQPLVIAIEDLHWIDPSTLELLRFLAERSATARLLLIYTARPEFRAPWPMRAHHTQITLNRLSASNVRTLVGQVAAHKALSDEIIATVVERTGGVPLFVEELTRAILENSDKTFTGREIPVTLHDSLMARLDRLGPAKEVAQVAAVIGGEFSYELLHAIYPSTEEDLQRALHSLADSELLYVQGIAPNATYQFKHALIRDAAYEALLKSRRRELHRLVARTINEKFPTLEEAHPEVLARHWTEAGDTEPAIAAWTKGGKAAEDRNAFPEALESYQQALALLKLLPESPERDGRELELRQAIVWMLYVTKSHASPEVIAATGQAAALAEKSGNLRQLAIWVNSRALATLLAGDLPAASTLADQALELALRDGNPANLGVVHVLQIMLRYWLGDLAGAEDHFTAGLKFFENAEFRQFPGSAVAAFGFASLNAWTLGRTEVARHREIQMMDAVKEKFPYDVALAGILGGYFRIYIRQFEQAEALAGRALKLSEKHQLSTVAAASRCVLGQARAQLGRAREGSGLIRQGIDGLLELGSGLGITRETTHLAKAQEREGALVEALETVEQALRSNPDEIAYRPESLRLRGELRLKQGIKDLAEADFHEAIALAKTMNARAWELRATMSLTRLLASQGRRDEARTMLAEIYNWFTEGFDTADLKDAKTLLHELTE